MADTANNNAAPDQNQYAPTDLLSQFILGIPRGGSPLLPPDTAAGFQQGGTGKALSSPVAPVAPQPSAPAVAPTDDPLALPRAAVMRSGQNLQNATDKVNQLESGIAANKPVDPSQYKPHWYDRLLGVAAGTAAGFGNPEAAGPTANAVAYRGYNRAVAARNRALEPLFTQLNQEKDVNLPLYKEENTNAMGQLREAREQGLDTAREEADRARADKYSSTIVSGSEYKDANSPTGWSAKTADGKTVTFTPKATEKPVADPKNADEALSAASAALGRGDHAEYDRLTKLAKGLHQQEIDRARESRPPKDETKTKPNVIENEKSLAVSKARSDYARAQKAFQDDPKGLAEAKDNFVQALREAQNSYEAKVAENGGTPEHWDVDENGNFTKAAGGPSAAEPAPAQAAPKGGIRVREKSTGRTGTIPADKADAAIKSGKYEKLL